MNNKPEIQVELEPLGVAVRVSVQVVIPEGADSKAERERIRLGILKAAGELMAGPGALTEWPEGAVPDSKEQASK